MLEYIVVVIASFSTVAWVVFLVLWLINFKDSESFRHNIFALGLYMSTLLIDASAVFFNVQSHKIGMVVVMSICGLIMVPFVIKYALKLVEIGREG